MILQASDPAALEAFSRLAMGEGVIEPCQTPGYVRLAAGHARRNPVVVLPADPGSTAWLAVRRVGPFRQVVLPPLAPYSSILVSPGASDAATRAMASELESSFDDLVVHLPPNHPFEPVAASRGWSVSRLSTYMLDPSRAADASSWSGSTARNYRRNVASYEVARDPGEVEAAVALCLGSYRRSGRRAPVDPRALGSLARAVVDAGLAECRVARNASGLVEAAIVTLTAGRASSYWMAGSLPGPSMTVLLGRAFGQLADEGITRFDFVGANTASIAEFKRRFGGTKTAYCALRRTPNRILAMALTARRSATGILFRRGDPTE